ncbi:MAG: hypothetical protein WCW93_00055 [Candidatus Paceibacterota bacterium]
MMQNFNPEKIKPISQEILNMYKIDGYEDIDYKKYLQSKSLLGSRAVVHEQSNDSQPSVLKTKNYILSQDAENITIYIMDALQNNDIEIQRMAASIINNAPEDQQRSLKEMTCKKIIEALNNPNIEIQRIAVNMIQFTPEDTRDGIKYLVLKRILDAFNSNDVGKQKIMAKKIDSAPIESQDNLREIVYQKILEALNQEDVRIQRLAATMVQYAPINKQGELKSIVKIKYESAKQQRKFNQIVEPPLYTKSENSNPSTFSHEKLSKTGSEITLLLGDQFKKNLIIRHFEEPCFLAWQKAYESYANWNKAGFDYIPIEPIHSFKYSEYTQLVNVASGVLDLNLDEWYSFSGDTFKEYLDVQKDKIINTLKELEITHGHANNANFCLRFYRNKNGSVDLDRIPRIYLIDFDKAVKS